MSSFPKKKIVLSLKENKHDSSVTRLVLLSNVQNFHLNGQMLDLHQRQQNWGVSLPKMVKRQGQTPHHGAGWSTTVAIWIVRQVFFTLTKEVERERECTFFSFFLHSKEVKRQRETARQTDRQKKTIPIKTSNE